MESSWNMGGFQLSVITRLSPRHPKCAVAPENGSFPKQLSQKRVARCRSGLPKESGSYCFQPSVTRGNEAGNCTCLWCIFFFQLWLVREVQWKIHIFCPPEIRTASESQESQLTAGLKRLSENPLTWNQKSNLVADVAAISGITLSKITQKMMLKIENLAWMVQVPPRSWRAIQSQGKFPKQGTDSQDHQPGQKLVTKIEGSCVWYLGAIFLLILRFKTGKRICKNM